MKKMNKKGFTIVELVIVIAVIAILAAVLIPTFSGVVKKANKSAAEQEARNMYTEYVLSVAEKGDYVDDCWIKTAKGYYVQITGGSIVAQNEYTTTAPSGLVNTVPTSDTYDAGYALAEGFTDVWVAYPAKTN